MAPIGASTDTERSSRVVGVCGAAWGPSQVANHPLDKGGKSAIRFEAETTEAGFNFFVS